MKLLSIATAFLISSSASAQWWTSTPAETPCEKAVREYSAAKCAVETAKNQFLYKTCFPVSGVVYHFCEESSKGAQECLRQHKKTCEASFRTCNDHPEYEKLRTRDVLRCMMKTGGKT